MTIDWHSFDERRRIGCTVTWRDGDGVDRVDNEPGPMLMALERITRRIPEGGRIRTISTPRSILHDLSQMPRRYGGAHRNENTSVDAYAFERNMLGKVHRLDLLPEEAYPQGRGSVDGHRLRASSREDT
jgi:hypothetical protein